MYWMKGISFRWAILCKTLEFALYKSDGKPDSGDEPLPDDGKGDQPGGGSGDDGDEAPDPTV